MSPETPTASGRAFPQARGLPTLGSVAGPGAWGYIEEPMVELSLIGVRVELPGNQPIVLLKEREGERYLPIWIGTAEATAIAFALQGVVTARPMTHDLMKNVLEELGVRVDRISITELREGTFCALIQMARHGSSFEISSRPSDCTRSRTWSSSRSSRSSSTRGCRSSGSARPSGTCATTCGRNRTGSP